MLEQEAVRRVRVDLQPRIRQEPGHRIVEAGGVRCA
jgi:hypothetical protein